MGIADKIIEALREKYRPLGIAVYGSFADGSNNRNSDFDALLLLPDGETGHDDSVLFGTELDVWLYGTAHFAAPYDAEEGCLSLTGTRKTKRFQTIKVQWQNEQFQTRIKTFTDWTAQIIQHEIDHCEGILI